MRIEALADTSFLLALLDPAELRHQECVAAFAVAPLPLGVSSAVLTEFFHLIARQRSDIAAGWRIVRSKALRLLPISSEDLPDLQALMIKYGDRPMDFADATLVHLARREGISIVLTLDDADFDVYRVDGRRRLRVLPGRR